MITKRRYIVVVKQGDKENKVSPIVSYKAICDSRKNAQWYIANNPLTDKEFKENHLFYDYFEIVYVEG